MITETMTSRAVTPKALMISLPTSACPWTGGPQSPCSSRLEIQCQYWTGQERSSQSVCACWSMNDWGGRG